MHALILADVGAVSGNSQWEQGSVKGMGAGKFNAEEPEKMLSHPPCLFVLTAPGSPGMIM